MMGWKENKKKHDEFVNKVADLLLGISNGRYTLVKEGDEPLYLVKKYIKEKYNLNDRDFDVKLISRRKNKYHFKVTRYDVIDYIDMKVVVE